MAAPASPPRIPKYRLHKGTGQAFVELNGRRTYLGRHGTPPSREQYDRMIAEWLANNRQPPLEGCDGITAIELIAGFLQHAQQHYRRPDGRPTSEYETYRQALRPLYGSTPAGAFGPKALRLVSSEMVNLGCPPWVSQVTVDIELIVNMAVHFAYSLGHRRMLLVRNSGSYYLDSVGRAFRHEMQGLGCSQDCDELHVQPGTDGEELLHYLASSKIKPTMVIAEGGLPAGRNLYAMTLAGWRIPQQLSLLAINGVSEDWLCISHLSRIETPRDQMVARLTQVLSESLERGTIIRERIAPRLIWGKTCGQVDAG